MDTKYVVDVFINHLFIHSENPHSSLDHTYLYDLYPTSIRPPLQSSFSSHQPTHISSHILDTLPAYHNHVMLHTIVSLIDYNEALTNFSTDINIDFAKWITRCTFKQTLCKPSRNLICDTLIMIVCQNSFHATDIFVSNRPLSFIDIFSYFICEVKQPMGLAGMMPLK